MDRALLQKKLAFIETCVRELKELARPEQLESDVRERRFVEHTLQLAIQAALDVASHWVSERRLGEPESNRQLFFLLAWDDVIESDLAEVLAAMAGFRNILVHGYQSVDPAKVRLILTDHLNDLEVFCMAMAGTVRKTSGNS
ncbi:HepT-like ribonuclease domain-containing protein [Thioalkalivibrio sp. ALE28]|uniref:type VII toxin-antitoxin system HepT family RNase toxin n=1 Tax=Thioalkalivibrio sp. ALE28 TaxID=1158179 RepID=UPI0003805E03